MIPRFVRLLPVLAVAVAAALMPAPRAAAQDVMRIAAVVNEDMISMYDLNARLRLMVVSAKLRDSVETRRRLAPEVMRTLIDERLKLQEAERMGVSVSDQEIARAKANLEKRNGLPPGGLEPFMERAGVEMSTVTDQIRATLAWYKVVAQKAKGRAEISDAAVDAMLNRMEANAGKPEHYLHEIFLPVDGPEADEQARRLAQRLASEVRDGGSFERLAQQFSAGATAQDGGRLGWVSVEQIPDDLVDVVESLPVGAVSEPVRSPMGYHLLRVTDRRVPREDDTVQVTLSQVVLPKGDTAAAAARVAQATSCEDMEQVGRDMDSPLSGPLGTVAMGQLPDPVREVVAGLPLNQPSTPVETPNGEVVLMVCERSEAAEASVHAKRERVRNLLQEQRMEMLSRQFLRELRRSAIIDVRI